MRTKNSLTSKNAAAQFAGLAERNGASHRSHPLQFAVALQPFRYLLHFGDFMIKISGQTTEFFHRRRALVEDTLIVHLEHDRKGDYGYCRGVFKFFQVYFIPIEIE